MGPQAKKWLKFSLRWGIAIVGITIVVSKMSLYDKTVVDANGAQKTELGLVSMWNMAQAHSGLLWAALFVFPITVLICSYRWHELLKALDIYIGQARAFVLNMVGNFYNSFMPGMTGGDVLKAYYASKQTPHRTRAVMSVFIDRIIGLLGLVILGGVMSTYQYFHDTDASVRRACGKVSLGSVAILGGTALGLFIFFHPLLRRYTGLDFVIKRLPMQKQVRNAIDTMETLRTRRWLVFWALLITIPVHIAVVFSAMFSGEAFGLPIPTPYYFVCVPVIVLSGAIPISPQGAGVMEFMAYLLIKRYGASVNQAVALTMSIRLVQVFWYMVGGIFVFRGGYHVPPKGALESQEPPVPDKTAA